LEVSYPVEIVSREPGVGSTTFDDITKITINFNQKVARNEQSANIRIFFSDGFEMFKANNLDNKNLISITGSMVEVTGFNINQDDNFYIEMDEGFVIPFACNDKGYASASIKGPGSWPFQRSEEVPTTAPATPSTQAFITISNPVVIIDPNFGAPGDLDNEEVAAPQQGLQQQPAQQPTSSPWVFSNPAAINRFTFPILSANGPVTFPVESNAESDIGNVGASNDIGNIASNDVVNVGNLGASNAASNDASNPDSADDTSFENFERFQRLVFSTTSPTLQADVVASVEPMRKTTKATTTIFRPSEPPVCGCQSGEGQGASIDMRVPQSSYYFDINFHIDAVNQRLHELARYKKQVETDEGVVSDCSNQLQEQIEDYVGPLQPLFASRDACRAAVYRLSKRKSSIQNRIYELQSELSAAQRTKRDHVVHGDRNGRLKFERLYGRSPRRS